MYVATPRPGLASQHDLACMPTTLSPPSPAPNDSDPLPPPQHQHQSSIVTQTKGLLNGPGQNNCFLNSAVQVLWHLDIFRRSFRELEGHACMADSCIFCALKELFNQFQYSHESALPPDALRRALAETFANQQRFQLGFMDDAAECFENILLRIHFHVANSESEDMCNAKHCISHQKFAMTLVEQRVCHSCGATSEPLPFTQMVHYISSSALCAQSKMNFDNGNNSERFGQLLRKACGIGEIRDCPSTCGAKIQIHRTLMNHPEIISIGIVWDSERPTLEHIMNVFQTVGTSIKLQDVFHSVVDGQWANSAAHQLVGVVTYYGKHYSTFFFHTKLRVWIYFDDATVREIGPHWEQVVEKCRRGHFQPLLLLYANPCGTAITTEFAPKTVTYASGHCRSKLMGHMYHAMDKGSVNGGVTSPLRRALTPNPDLRRDAGMPESNTRRAVTPSADLHHNDLLNGGRAGSKLAPTGMTTGSVPVQYRRHPSDSDAGYSSSDRGHPALSGGYRESIRRPAIGGGGSSETDSVFHSNPTPYPASGYQQQQQYPTYGYEQQKAAPNGPLRTNGYFNNCDGLGLPPTPPTVSDKDPAALENIYISRRTVESVLNYQKVQRHQRQHAGGAGTGAAGNRNSNSSLESFENALRMRSQYNAYYEQMRPEGQQQIQQPEAVAPAPPSNVPRCRDSGNWSGDRNSASSTSSASLENPYYVMVGNKRSSAPSSPGYHYLPSKSPTEGGTYRPGYDAGYDSFSLSSNDSFPHNGHPKHNQQLAQIPENVLDQSLRRTVYNGEPQDECQSLCYEADSFLEKSIEKEQFGDLDGAISLCNGAAAKARAAMDAPYSNPQILAFAKIKHSSCVMRSRSLHRRILARQDSINSHGSSTGTETDSPHKTDDGAGGDAPGHHHSRQSSRDSTRSRNGHHSRQSSRDGASHSRQGSRDGGSHSRQSSQDASENKKRIELYGTLPKKGGKKKLDKARTGSVRLEDENVLHRLANDMINAKPEIPYINKQPHVAPTLLGAELLKVQRVNEYVMQKQQDRLQQQQQLMMAASASCTDYSDYSSEWEHTRKPVNLHRTNSIPPNFHHQVELSTSQSFTDLSAAQSKDDKLAAANKMAAAGKKQHKIRRKLLMGGLIRRKNRSMPDLREGQNDGATPTDKNAGQLTEHSSDAYQNMYNEVVNRRLHSSHSKIPPPPPVRTTSQLTTRSLSQGNLTTVPGQDGMDAIGPCPPLQPRLVQPGSSRHQYPMVSQQSSNRLTIQADVHHERTPSDGIRPVNLTQRLSAGGATYGRVDNPRSSLPAALPSSEQRSLNASPYGQVAYQPQPEVDRVPNDIVVAPSSGSGEARAGQGGLLAALQAKRRQLLEGAASRSGNESVGAPLSSGAKSPPPSANDNWLQELQAKQQLLKSKKGSASDVRTTTARSVVDQVPVNNYPRSSPITPQHHDLTPKINQLQSVDTVDGFSDQPSTIPPPTTEPVDYKPKSVRDLASRFEKINIPPMTSPASAQSPPPLNQPQQQPPIIKKEVAKPQVEVQPITKPAPQQWHTGTHVNAPDRVDGRLLVHTLDFPAHHHHQNHNHEEQSRLTCPPPVHQANRVYDYQPGYAETPSSQTVEPVTKYNGYTSASTKDPLYLSATGPTQNGNYGPISPPERQDTHRITGPMSPPAPTRLDNAQLSLNQRGGAPAYNANNNNYHQQGSHSNGLPAPYVDSNYNAPNGNSNNVWTDNQNYHNAYVSNMAPAASKMAANNCIRKMSDPGFADGTRHPEFLSRLQPAQNGLPLTNQSGNGIPSSTNDVPPSMNRPIVDSVKQTPPSYQNALSMSTMQWPQMPTSSATTNGLSATAVAAARKSAINGGGGGGAAIGHHGSLRRNHSVCLPVSTNGKEMALPSADCTMTSPSGENGDFTKKKKGKKSVTFSDQIALVASADDDVMLPHPLLEKALNRSSIMSKPSQQPQQQPIQPAPSASSTVQVPVFNEASYTHMTNCNTITNGITAQHRGTLQYNKYDNLQPLPAQSVSAGLLQDFNAGGGYVIQNGHHGSSYPNGQGYNHVADNGGQSKPAVMQTGANGKVPCHLCRKKTVAPPVVYCQDCDFYMSRFKPR